jgi:hypothetical protein
MELNTEQAKEAVELLDGIVKGLVDIDCAIQALPLEPYNPDRDGSAFIGISNGLHRIGAALEACAEQQARQNEVLRDIQLTMPIG